MPIPAVLVVTDPTNASVNICQQFTNCPRVGLHRSWTHSPVTVRSWMVNFALVSSVLKRQLQCLSALQEVMKLNLWVFQSCKWKYLDWSMISLPYSLSGVGSITIIICIPKEKSPFEDLLAFQKMNSPSEKSKKKQQSCWTHLCTRLHFFSLEALLFSFFFFFLIIKLSFSRPMSFHTFTLLIFSPIQLGGGVNQWLCGG